MEKTIVIDGKEVKFKSTGATPIKYKAQFGTDYFKEILKLAPLIKVMENIDEDTIKDLNPADLEGLDLEVFYNVAWVLAKTANKDIPDIITWLDEFDEFPIMEFMPEFMELIQATLQSKKNMTAPKNSRKTKKK